MPVLTNIFLVEGLQERRGEGRRELEWRRWTGPADALQAALAVLLAAGFPALFEHHSEEDVTASMLVAGENDGDGDGDDGVRLPTSITVPRLWVFGAPTLLDSFLHHAMLHPFVSLQEDERGMWGGDSDDQATERLVVSLQRLLEGRLVSKGFERTEDGFVCPSPLPARRDGASAASSAIVCRIEAFSYGDRLGFYCSVGARAAARSLNLRSSNPEEDERSRFDGATTTRRGRRQGGGAAAASRAARHSDSEHSTPHAVSSSEFLAQVLIDQLGFNTSAAEEEEWTAPRPWASSGLTSPASAQDAMDMEGGAGLDSLEDRLAGKRTRATDASLLSPFSDAVGDSRSAKRSRPQEPSPLGGPLYASPTGGIVSPAAVTTASPLPDAAAVVKDEPAAPVAVPPPAAAAATKAGKEDDAWYLLNDDSNDIDIDFESLIRSLSTEDSANAAAAAAAAVAAAAIMPPEPAVKPEPTATAMASPFDQFADVGAAAMRDATAAAAAALLDGSGPDDAMILAGMSVSSSAPSPLTAAAATPTSLSEADVIATLEEPSSTQSAPDQAGERLLLHVWPTGYSPLPIPPTPPNARYSYRPTSQPSPSARVDSPSPAPPLSFRWWKRISESSSSSSSSSSASSITSSSTPSTSATTATATWSAAASAALSATPLLKSEVDDLLSPKSNGFVSPSSTSLSEAEEAEAKARLTEEIDDIGPELGALMVREVVMQQCSSTFDMLFLGISPSGLSLLDDSGGSGGPGPGSGSGGGPSTAWFVPTTNAALRRSSGGDAGDTTLDGAEVDPLFALVQQYSKDRAVAAQARSQLTAEGLMHALATVGQALNGHTQHQLQHHAAEADSFATGGLSVVGPLSLAQWNQEERAELEELAPPSLVVGFRDEWLNIPPTAIRLWEKALLEPYAPRKNVAFYALVPNDPLMSRALPGFLRDLTAAYQTANLGAHEPAIEDNIRWVELSDVEAAMRSYRRAAKDLAQELLRQWRSGSYQTQAEGSVVVYVVDPGPLAPTGAAPTAPQELLRCAVPLLRAAKDLPHLNIAFQILPTALLLEPWTGPSLRDLAFSVFSKCRRMSSPHSSEKLYEPVYVLAAPEPDAATTFVLHVAYSSSSTPQVPLLVIATLTDARGEMRQSLYLDSTHALAQLWQCALMAIARVSATWRIVIGKLGQLAAAEAQEWEGLVASWRAGGGRAGRARVASVALVQVTPHPHLHLLPALGSDLLPDLSASASQGSSASSSSSQGGSDGDPPVEVSTHAHRSLELELFDAWRTSSSLHLGNSYLLPRPPPAPGSVGALADPTAAAPMASVALLNPSLSQFHVRWPASTATLVISLVSLTDLQWSGEPQQHQAEAMLREVGRDYHRLSWLTLSSATGRRLLPLPLHFLAPAASSSFFSAAPST